jgi:hypothetical protein
MICKSIFMLLILLVNVSGVQAGEKVAKPRKACNENEIYHTFLVIREKSDVCEKHIKGSKHNRIEKKMDPGLFIILNTDKGCFGKKGCELPLIWQDGPINVPEKYTVEIDSTEKYKYLKSNDLMIGSGRVPAYVTYFTHNHGPVKMADGNKMHKLYKTNHGVIIEDIKTKKWAWLFVSNRPKLRWPSIGNASFIGENEVEFDIETLGQKSTYIITWKKPKIKMKKKKAGNS